MDNGMQTSNGGTCEYCPHLFNSHIFSEVVKIKLEDHDQFHHESAEAEDIESKPKGWRATHNQQPQVENEIGSWICQNVARFNPPFLLEIKHKA
jgi:ribosomal protein L16 Arg81 hydroxylase